MVVGGLASAQALVLAAGTSFIRPPSSDDGGRSTTVQRLVLTQISRAAARPGVEVAAAAAPPATTTRAEPAPSPRPAPVAVAAPAAILAAAAVRPPAPKLRPSQADGPLLVRVRIAGSLQRTARGARLPAGTIREIVRVLSWDVDFQRDLRAGDRLEVVLDPVVEGARATSRTFAYLGLTLSDRRVDAYRFVGRDGRAGYYDADGRPVRKSLLRTPIDGVRVSSAFGWRRHPVLGYTRMHKGIDFAAPSGTPVLAAGDGTVEMAGPNGGYGRYVRLRHDATYATAYGHLSRLARGIVPGARIGQGQVLGYVGATGLATGPHLHYEVLEGGEQVNPLQARRAYAERLEGAEMRRFRAVRDGVDRVRRGGDPGDAARTLVASRGD